MTKNLHTTNNNVDWISTHNESTNLLNSFNNINNNNNSNINIDINNMTDKIDLNQPINLMEKFNEFYNNKSKIDTITCIEKPNLYKLNFILNNQDILNNLNYENIFNDALSYKSILKKKSQIKVVYKNNKNIRRKMYPTLNSTTMSRNLRNFIFDDVIDLDIQNSAISVLINLIEIYKLGTFPILYELNNNKSNFLIENDCCKNDLVSILNGGIVNKSDKLTILSHEINDLFDKFKKIDNFKELFKSCQNYVHYENKTNNENKKVKNSFLSWVYQSIETKIIDIAYQYFAEKYEISSLEYDGLKLRTKEFTKIDDLNNYINLKSGLNIKFCKKPMKIDETLNKFFIDNFKEEHIPILCFDTDKHLITYNNLTKDGFLKVSEIIAEELKKDVKYCNGNWIGCNHNLWINYDNILTFISKSLHLGIKEYERLIYYHLKKYESYYNQEEEDKIKLIKTIQNSIIKIESSTFLTHINKCLISLLEDNEFEKKLDRNPYCIAFKNGIYDVRTKTFKNIIDKTDYLSKTLDFDFNENINKLNIENIKHEIFKICNCNKEELDYYLRHIAYMLCGDPSKYQYFYCNIGQLAGNGKSFMFEVLEDLMPCYVKKLNSQILEEDYSKKHKFLPAFGNYRIIWLNEMKSDSKICAKIYKEIADGTKLNNEVMFGCQKIIHILAKAVLISNHTPVFDHADNGVHRRLKMTQHNSQFREDIKEDDYENKKFIDNKQLKSTFLNEYKMDFMHMLLDEMHQFYINGFPKTPNLYLHELNEIKDTNNQFAEWFDENIEIDNSTNKKGKLINGLTKYIIKERLEEDLKINYKDAKLRDDFKKMGIKYDKTVFIDYKRGGFRGIKFKKKYFNKSEIESSSYSDSDSE